MCVFASIKPQIVIAIQNTFQHQLTKGGGIPEGGTPGKGGAWLGPLLPSAEDCHEQESPYNYHCSSE